MRNDFLVVLSVMFLSAAANADNERLYPLRTTLPVGPNHVAHIVIEDHDGLVVLDTLIVGPMVDIKFPFVASDLNGDGGVNFDDFFVFGENFGLVGPRRADLDRSGRVDFSDFFAFAEQFGLSMDAGSAKTADDQRRRFADELEWNARRFGAELSNPAVQAEIARLRQKLAGEYGEAITAGSDISLDGVQLYNILGQSLSANSFLSLGSGVYFAKFSQGAAVRFNVQDGTAVVNSAPVYNLDELARYARPRARVSAKTAAIGFSFTISIVSEDNSFEPTIFEVLAPAPTAPGEPPPVIQGTILEISGGTAEIVPTIPPDTTPPLLALSVANTLVHYSVSETVSLPASFTLTVGDQIRRGTATDAYLSGTSQYDLPPGRYGVLFTAIDSAGNNAELRDSLIVLPPPVVVTYELVVTGPSEVGYGEQPFSIAAVLITYEDGVETGREEVAPDEGTEVSGLPPGESTLTFHYSGVAAAIRVLVVDRPPQVKRIQLDRYLSAPAEGRGMVVRADVSDDLPITGVVRFVATNGSGGAITADGGLNLFSPESGVAGAVVSIPANPTMSDITWTLTGYFTDSAGQTGSASLQFTQAGRTTPPPPPPPPPEPEPEPEPPPPAPNINDARVNGTAPGAVLQLNFGDSISCSAPLSGIWSFAGNSLSGTSASFNAVNGTLSFTANGATVTWNIQASPAP